MKAFEPGSENAYTYHREPGPIDNQAEVKVYRLNPDGSKGEFLRTMPAFPEGWDARKLVPEAGRKKEEEEDDSKMARVRKDKEKIMAKARPMLAAGKSIKQTSKELGVPTTTLFQWLKKEKEQQTQPPEPEQAANQGPKREEKEPAAESVPKLVPPVNMPLGAELPREDDTITQYNEQIKQGGFTAADEEPIPYQLVETILEHHHVADEIAELLDQKRADYGTENIKKFGSYGVLVRVSDKVERLINLSCKEGQVNFESVEDSWKDIAGYAILALIELREGR